MAGKIKNRRKNTNEPGRAALWEDSNISTATMHFERGEHWRPAPMVKGVERASREEVETRLLRAVKTINAIPDKERRFFIQGNGMPEYVQEYVHAYAADEVKGPRFEPTPSDVDDCLTALSWMQHLEKRYRKVIKARAYGFSYAQIGEKIGRSKQTAKNWYCDALTDVWIAANKTAIDRRKCLTHCTKMGSMHVTIGVVR